MFKNKVVSSASNTRWGRRRRRCEEDENNQTSNTSQDDWWSCGNVESTNSILELSISSDLPQKQLRANFFILFSPIREMTDSSWRILYQSRKSRTLFRIWWFPPCGGGNFSLLSPNISYYIIQSAVDQIINMNHEGVPRHSVTSYDGRISHSH